MNGIVNGHLCSCSCDANGDGGSGAFVVGCVSL